jgi:hypothetical protein
VQAWWLDSSGAVFSGAPALNAALSTALGSGLPMWVYRFPGIGAVQNAVDRWGGGTPISVPRGDAVVRGRARALRLIDHPLK